MIKASQPAQRRQKTMAGSIVREERREGCRAKERGIAGDSRTGEGFRRDATDEKISITRR